MHSQTSSRHLFTLPPKIIMLELLNLSWRVAQTLRPEMSINVLLYKLLAKRALKTVLSSFSSKVQTLTPKMLDNGLLFTMVLIMDTLKPSTS